MGGATNETNGGEISEVLFGAGKSIENMMQLTENAVSLCHNLVMSRQLARSRKWSKWVKATRKISSSLAEQLCFH